MTFLLILVLLAWGVLLAAHGRFWRDGPILPRRRPADPPAVAVVVPARNEAENVAPVLRSLLGQDYVGSFEVVLVDDGSGDGTGDIARGLGDPRLRVIAGQPRPPGWSGKLWALAQGAAATEAPWLLFTDADIVHGPSHLAGLVAQAEAGRLDLVSEMAALRTRSLPERALVPAFVYFFQLLYPFETVNDPGHIHTGAAAGGVMLLRRAALDRIGGLEAIRGELIDDVALGAAVKRVGRVWLGHSEQAVSVRPYPRWRDVFAMISRTAYVQLRFSPALLLGTVLAMGLTWLLPPLAALFAHGAARVLGGLIWILMAASYWPSLRRRGRSPLWAPTLPLWALFFLAATVSSAINHHTRRGVTWRGRAYAGEGA